MTVQANPPAEVVGIRSGIDDALAVQNGARLAVIDKNSKMTPCAIRIP